jgi:hypothetical protein
MAGETAGGLPGEVPGDMSGEMPVNGAGLASLVVGFGAIGEGADSSGAARRGKKFSKLSGLEGTTGNNNRMRMSRLNV